MNVEILRSICLAFPLVTEDVKWGNDLCFLVNGKMFCVVALTGPMSVSFKTTPKQFIELCEQPGIRPAPYLGRHKWVQITHEAVITKSAWETLLAKSYQLIAKA